MRHVFAAIIGAVLMVVFTGCSNLMESTKDKSVNLQSAVYGFKVTAFDPSTGSVAPVGEMGFGSIDYHSTPMVKGQPYYARRSVYSLWSNNPSSETTIWVGRASESCVLQFEAVPNTMIKISADGTVKSGVTTVDVVADGGEKGDKSK